MDNNFENGANVNEPQRPFTERQGEIPPAQNPAYGFNPEKPLMQQPQEQPQAPQNEQSFNPIEHTAMYQDGAFRAPAQPQNPNQGYNAQPTYGTAQGTDYSHPSYYNAGYSQQPNNAFPQYAQPPVPPAQPPVPPRQPEPRQNFVTPLQGGNVNQTAQNPYGNPYQAPNPAPQQQGYYIHPVQEKKKGNKGLIAVIIVLAVLLAGSFTGMLIYAFSQAANNNPDSNFSDNGSQFQIPEFTIPQQQQATEAPVYDESDYSDKVQKDYKGLELAAKPADAATNKSYGAEYAFEKVSPSVVGIVGYTDKDKKIQGSEGSGIIISADGYVITNAHVILNSKTALLLTVYTADGKEYNAGVVGFDSRTDIAVLKLDDASGLTPAQFGDSSKLELGEDIIIVGNPGGLSFQNSMTKGIVSALDRDASNKSIVKYIQTDAAINPGNSGGPAVNMYGQIIGIATSKIVDEKYEGMGFCIPSATAKSIIDDLMKNGYVQGRVKIGISGVALTSSEAAELGVSGGIMVETVDPDGPCGKIGLGEGDIITEADGQAITSFSDIFNVLENHKEGDKIKIKYSHYEGGSNGFSGTYTEKEAEIELQADKG